MQTTTLPAGLLTGANAGFIADLYSRYLRDPDTVDASWQSLFAELKDDLPGLMRESSGASWTPQGQAESAPAEAATARPAAGPVADATILDSLRALTLIRAHRVRGHLEAHLDPLGLAERISHADLDPATYGFGPGDWDRPIFVDGLLGLDRPTLRQLMETLQATYCGSIGVEYMHIQNHDERAWIQNRIEAVPHNSLSKEERERVLGGLTVAEGFEKFLQVKYTGTKRFGLEGGESLVPCIEEVLNLSAELGVAEVIFGMAHRGRLNILTNVMGKPFTAIFSEFQGNSANPADVQGSGDVKYHLGTSNDRVFSGRTVHVSLTANPSHLEAVNPVVLGKVRAKQAQANDEDRATVMGLLIHGDAAMAGQGLVAECFALAELKGYRTGGTMHIVINNQIGFTTAPQYSRSGPYATDVAKAIQTPVFHVNGDDPDAVAIVSRIAAEYRAEFSKDVVIDIICYRRHGHNEGDEPGFTQPLMYRTIRDHATTRELYAKTLEGEGVIQPGEAEALLAEFQQGLEEDFQAASAYKPNKADWLEGRWAGMASSSSAPAAEPTGVELDVLRQVGSVLARVPDGIETNVKIVRQLKAKAEMFAGDNDLDWSTGEALAFGTLLCEGHPVRLSGQDSGRGTFSQRHAAIYCQSTEERYVALEHVATDQAKFEVLDSPLSEAAVLGFEYGYSLAEPQALVLWEGQFGDFVNGAQVIIDQFISSAESKWLRMSGLVLLLPHGYEGQGPEHSSARLERFLQLCAEDNLQVANCTTPASYFHILRRQLHRPYRKPLILMTPKSLLRHKLAVSKLADFGPGTGFQRVIGNAEALDDAAVKRVVLCSGKVYYDLLEERQKRGIKDVALVRLEQLYPFASEELSVLLGRYATAEVVWCQEEPRNMGAWTFIDRRLETVLTGIDHACKRPVYVGRPEAASPATGLLKRHIAEQGKLVGEALVVSQ